MSIVMLQRPPVPHGITQRYASNPTGGIIPDPNGTPMQQLVYHYGNYQEDGHDGDDWGCPAGTLVYPAGPGRVDYAGPGELMPEWCANKWAFAFGPAGWASGNIVCVDNSIPGLPPLGTYYAHGLEVLARTGAAARTDQPIMRSGGAVGAPGSGRSGGEHLHASAVLLDQVWTARRYGRISILDRLPAGSTIPLAPGAGGAPASETDDLIAGISGLSK